MFAAMNGTISTVPDFAFVLPAEYNFDRVRHHAWISDSFLSVPVLVSVVYLISLYAGQHLMKSRSAFDPGRVLFFWNASLALFSFLATVRLLPEFLHVIKHLGWRHSICSFSFYDDSPVSALWSYLFVLSKLPELLDTLFLVLRKRQVIFLHWFHHCSVLVFTWFLLKDKAAIGRWFMNMNCLVHCFMYTYYSLAALRVRPPRIVALCVTTSQIAQMIFGTVISLQVFAIWLRGEKCSISGAAATSAILIYAIYLILFLNFFITTYLVSPRTGKKTKSS